MPDLVAGQIDLIFTPAADSAEHVRGRTIKPYAIMAKARMATAAYIPTVDEAALPGFEANTWHGVVVPAGTPAAIVTRLNREIVAILHLPDVVERFSGQGAEAPGQTSGCILHLFGTMGG